MQHLKDATQFLSFAAETISVAPNHEISIEGREIDIETGFEKLLPCEMESANIAWIVELHSAWSFRSLPRVLGT